LKLVIPTPTEYFTRNAPKAIPVQDLRKSKRYSMGKSQAIKIIKKFVKALRHEGISVDRVILYGSCVTGKVRPESDIDVAIVSKDFGKDRVEEGMTLYRIAGKVNARLEPVPISIEAYRNDTWVPLIYEIKAKGLELKVA
jgi:predicted nucleotidyltransferase